jgi:hypothetical protein
MRVPASFDPLMRDHDDRSSAGVHREEHATHPAERHDVFSYALPGAGS